MKATNPVILTNAVDVACDADECTKLEAVGIFYRRMTIEQALYIAGDREGVE